MNTKILYYSRFYLAIRNEVAVVVASALHDERVPDFLLVMPANLWNQNVERVKQEKKSRYYACASLAAHGDRFLLEKK